MYWAGQGHEGPFPPLVSKDSCRIFFLRAPSDFFGRRAVSIRDSGARSAVAGFFHNPNPKADHPLIQDETLFSALPENGSPRSLHSDIEGRADCLRIIGLYGKSIGFDQGGRGAIPPPVRRQNRRDVSPLRGSGRQRISTSGSISATWGREERERSCRARCAAGLYPDGKSDRPAFVCPDDASTLLRSF